MVKLKVKAHAPWDYMIYHLGRHDHAITPALSTQGVLCQLKIAQSHPAGAVVEAMSLSPVGITLLVGGTGAGWAHPIAG